MRYPHRSRTKAGLDYYARRFSKSTTGALETLPARAKVISHAAHNSTQPSGWGSFTLLRLPNPLTYYLQELPGLKGQGEWRQARCCFHADNTPSLSINVQTGGFYCHACQAKGGDVLDFHQQRHGLDFQEAAKQLGAWTND